jgi:hypothetical protein
MCNNGRRDARRIRSSTRLPQLRKAMETLGMLPVTLRRQEFYMQVKFAFGCKKSYVKTSFNDCQGLARAGITKMVISSH